MDGAFYLDFDLVHLERRAVPVCGHLSIGRKFGKMKQYEKRAQALSPAKYDSLLRVRVRVHPR